MFKRGSEELIQSVSLSVIRKDHSLLNRSIAYSINKIKMKFVCLLFVIGLTAGGLSQELHFTCVDTVEIGVEMTGKAILYLNCKIDTMLNGNQNTSASTVSSQPQNTTNIWPWIRNIIAVSTTIQPPAIQTPHSSSGNSFNFNTTYGTNTIGGRKR